MRIGENSYISVFFIIWKKKKRFDEKHTEVSCAFCKKKFFIKKWKIDKGGKFCSKKCHISFQGLLTNGRKPTLNVIRGLRVYKQWRENILERDKYTCCECGEKKCILEVDHIKPFIEIIVENKINSIVQAKECSDLWDISNGRTLCRKCHRSKTAKQQKLVFGLRKELLF